MKLKFRIDRDKGYTVLRAYEARTAREVGYFELQPIKIGSHRYMKVAFAEVTTPGAGIGTKMYEHAAKIACRAGAPLASDATRTKYSEGFWGKQAKKGRATCVARAGGVRLEAGTFAPKGRLSCRHYALTCPAPRSLAGLRGLGASKWAPGVRPFYVRATDSKGDAQLWLFATAAEADRGRENILYQTGGGRGYTISSGRFTAATPTVHAIRIATGVEPSRVRIHDTRRAQKRSG